MTSAHKDGSARLAGARVLAASAATVRNTTVGACRQRRRILSANYASNLRSASGLRQAPALGGPPEARSQVNGIPQPIDIQHDAPSVPGPGRVPARHNFFAPIGHFAAIFALLHQNFVMYCTKQ